MKTTELKMLKENRIEGETLNATKERLGKEGKLTSPTFPEPDEPQESMMPVPMQSKEIAVRPPEGMMLSAPIATDEDGFSQDDLIIPRWKSIQPTTRIEGVKEGHFYNSLTGELREKLENVVFLVRKNGRVLFPQTDFSGVRLCWSNDGCYPDSDKVLMQTGQQAKSSACVASGRKVMCLCAEWHRDEKGTATPPECRETITFLGLDLQSLTPFIMTFHGAAISPVRNFISAVYLKKKQATMQGKELHLRDFQIVLSLKLQMNEKGKYYIPVFEKVTQINDESQKQILSACFELLSNKAVDVNSVVDTE